MQAIFDFFQNYGGFISTAFGCIVFLIMLLKNGDTKTLKEIFNMVYRTEKNFDSSKVAGQKFSNLKPVYRLNKATNILELTDEVIDVTEIANSCKDMCMQSVLERFFPTDTIQDVEQKAVDLMQEDLDSMQETIFIANTYREKFGLSDDLSISQVFDFVKSKSEQLKEDIKKKGEKENEKAPIEESK